ncbi:unnamed protein product [Bursaphelenchus okinawaensis]|uniref:Uncharacterized protein n=1 Tax=Bursaphelenchus okinawaensis TaxID=465554 RepID=A0A811LLV6_9BILA|nr:unnamed protein product [Bursaphelenchus okinawaensis]CAG9125738.1 unnamed protein product [Bursaphelenchus okinawaensis]
MPILVVPLYGVYLVVNRITIPEAVLTHSVPYLKYKAQIRSKTWLRADMAISLTIACAAFGFGCVLFFGYFKTRAGSTYFLKAAIVSVIISFLYLIDAFLAVKQLNSASVEFIKNVSVNAFTTPSSKDFKVSSQRRYQQNLVKSYSIDENNTQNNHYQPQNSKHASAISNQAPLSTGRRGSSHLEIAKRKDSSWFDEDRRGDTMDNDGQWLYQSYDRQPEENHYLKVYKDSEMKHQDNSNRRGSTFMDSEEEFPPPPPMPVLTSQPQITPYKQTQFPRRVPVPPQRSTESFESTGRTIPRVNIPNMSSRSLHQHVTINPPAYKARVVVVEDDDAVFDRSFLSNNKKGSSSDGSTVRIDDVDKRSY